LKSWGIRMFQIMVAYAMGIGQRKDKTP
jgi:hypothetical protein